MNDSCAGADHWGSPEACAHACSNQTAFLTGTMRGPLRCGRQIRQRLKELWPASDDLPVPGNRDSKDLPICDGQNAEDQPKNPMSINA